MHLRYIYIHTYISTYIYIKIDIYIYIYENDYSRKLNFSQRNKLS